MSIMKRTIHPDRRGRRRIVLPVLLAASLLLGAAFEDELSDVGKSLSLFNNVFGVLHTQYAENLHAIRLVEAAIKGMLGELDPYSTYIEKEDRADVDIITTGAYGGLGISVAYRLGRHVVSGFVEADNTSESALRLGDEIVGVDSMQIRNTTPEALRRLLRGFPGTAVTLHLRRPGFPDTLHHTLTRHSVRVRTVSIFDSVSDGVYYVKLDRFTHAAVEDFRGVLRRVALNPAPRGLVLDLRNNPGGLLEAAVDIVSCLVPNGSPIVSTRGRIPRYSVEYFSTSAPILPSVPLAVLINENSASASEICAGAIQDLDRGVIIGTRSFGKGLVQNVLPLSDGASLKLTTSKYYIPSGRCIQKTGYADEHKGGAIIPEPRDSVRTYRTQKGRTVHEAGGVEPDLPAADDSLPPPVRTLVQDGVVFDFVSLHVNTRGSAAMPPLNADTRKMFTAFVDSALADSNDGMWKAYKRMMELAGEREYQPAFMNKASALGAMLRDQRDIMIGRHWETIRTQLDIQFAYHLGGDKFRFTRRIPSDHALQRAIAVLTDPAKYTVALETSH